MVTAPLESIMRQILTNAGYNGLEKIMTAKASPDEFGIDIDTGELTNMWKKGVIDPLLVKTMALESRRKMQNQFCESMKILSRGSHPSIGFRDKKVS